MSNTSKSADRVAVETPVERQRVIACGMLAREVLDVLSQPGLEHVDVHCLPAEFHHHPERIAPALEREVIKARQEGISNILVGYGDCGSGGDIDRICEKYGLERIDGPHCFAFYMGLENFFESEDEFLTSFFITDFLARHFETFFKRPLGLDRHPELLEMYFAHYDKAIYLAQTEDADLELKAREAAQYLGLKYEYHFTGYGGLETAIKARSSTA